MTSPGTAPTQQASGVLMLSVGVRLGLVVALIAALWLAVLWALA